MSLHALHFAFYNTTQTMDRGRNKAFLYYNQRNQGYLTLTPNHETVLTPGPLIPFDRHHFHPQGSLLYLFELDHVMTDAEIRAMQFDSQWEAQLFGGSGNPLYWGLTPRSAIHLAKGQSLDIQVPAWPLGNGKNKSFLNAEILYVHAEHITHHDRPKHDYFKVTFRDAPNRPHPPLPPNLCTLQSTQHLVQDSTQATAPAIAITLENQDDVVNQFQLVLHTQGYRSDFNTEFFLSFVTGAGAFGAFASPADQRQILLSFANEYPGWHITPQLDEPNPHWRVVPPPNQTLTDVVIDFHQVVTHLEIGWSALYVQYRSIQGYRDGHMILPLYKYSVPQLYQDKYIFPPEGPLIQLQWALSELAHLTIESIQSIDASCDMHRFPARPLRIRGHVNLPGVYAIRTSVTLHGSQQVVAEIVGERLHFGPMAPDWIHHLPFNFDDLLIIEAKKTASDSYHHVCAIPIQISGPTQLSEEQDITWADSAEGPPAPVSPLREDIHFDSQILYQGAENVGLKSTAIPHWNPWLVNDSSLVHEATLILPDGWSPVGFPGSRRFSRPLGYFIGP